MSYPMPHVHVCIGTKRGTNYGMVYNAEGAVIGRVFRDCKDAAGTYGPGGPSKRSFWTAELWMGNTRLNVPSLGTRHTSRAHAVRAIRLFWRWLWAEHGYGSARRLAYNVQRFKYEQREVCALNASPRVRVARPDRMYPRMAGVA